VVDVKRSIARYHTKLVRMYVCFGFNKGVCFMKKLLLGISSVILINTSYADPSIVVLDSRERVVFVQSDS